MSILLSRRTILGAGCLLAAGVRPAAAAGSVDVAMRGTADGARVWFEPVGLHVAPGTIIRWTNRDPGNAHSSTAYHPSNLDHPLRIPPAAAPWNSDYLLPDQSFEVRLTAEGVYDYFCMPHEMAGMAGRIVVGKPEPAGFWTAPPANVPDAVIATLPDVAAILKLGRIERPAQP